MEFQHLLSSGTPVDLPRMLEAREARARRQERLLREHPMPLISFSLNIAGPVKVFPLAIRTFEEGVELIRCQCRARGIPLRHAEQIREDTGLEAYFSADAPGETVKRSMLAVEEGSPLGRLFDIDVLDCDRVKLSRGALGKPERPCLVCGKDAFACGRSRAHSLEELQRCACSIMWDHFARQYAAKAASAASRALLYEALATPKPGLVDRGNTGAHSDMDIADFEASALALTPYFQALAAYGADHCREPLEAFLPALRELGIQAEVDMLRATGGVNTHRGIIFSLGFLLTALGVCYGRERLPGRRELRETCRQLAAPLAAEARGKRAVSHGEQVYIKYGVAGARGEAVNGFPGLFGTALPVMDRLLAQGVSWNDAGVVTLLHIMAAVEDTNLIFRSSLRRVEELQRQLRALLDREPPPSLLLAEAEALDRQFIAEHLSPGGSADLLALAYLIRFLERDGLMAAPRDGRAEGEETGRSGPEVKT